MYVCVRYTGCDAFFLTLSLPLLHPSLLHTISWLSFAFYLSTIGTAYFIYGEKVNVYSDDPTLNEFMEVGVKSAQNIGAIISIPPLYRYHIPTRTYREFVRTLNKVQDIGKIEIEQNYHSNEIVFSPQLLGSRR